MDLQNVAFLIRSQGSQMHKDRIERLRNAFGVNKKNQHRFIPLDAAIGNGAWGILPRSVCCQAVVCKHELGANHTGTSP